MKRWFKRNKSDKPKAKLVEVVEAEIVDKQSAKKDRARFVGSGDLALSHRLGSKWDGWVYDSVWELSVTVSARGLRATFDVGSDVFDRYRVGESVHVALIIPEEGLLFTRSPYLERWCSTMLEMDNVRALT